MALVLSEDMALPAPFYGPFASGLATAPWLDPMHATEFAARFAPVGPSELAAPAPRVFASTYVDALRQARRRIAVYRSMLVEPSATPDELDQTLLLAESRQFLSSPADGLALIAGVRDRVARVFRAVSVEYIPDITLASSTGSGIPVTVTNGADEALRVTVRLRSQHLRTEPSVGLRLAPGQSEQVTFRVDVRSTGKFNVLLQVAAPEDTCAGGRCVIVEQTLNVRSTVYNRIALAITIAAAALLLALWARRLLSRRTS